MSSATWIAFLAAAAIGASARYLLDLFVQRRLGGGFPWGTSVVNLSGSFLLGFLTGLSLYHALPSDARLVLGAGFCGAYTTFSTFAFETMRLAEGRATRLAVGNVLVSTVGGLALASLGLALALL